MNAYYYRISVTIPDTNLMPEFRYLSKKNIKFCLDCIIHFRFTAASAVWRRCRVQEHLLRMNVGFYHEAVMSVWVN